MTKTKTDYMYDFGYLALKCEGIIYGSFLRDVYVLKVEPENIEVCLAPDKKTTFKQLILEQFVVHEFRAGSSTLHLNDCSENRQNMRHYNLFYCSLSPRTNPVLIFKTEVLFSHWVSDSNKCIDSDFTCNLLMKDRYGLRLRYIPEILTHCEDPFEMVLKQIQNKELIVCGTPPDHPPEQCYCNIKYKLTLVHNAIHMIQNGWSMDNNMYIFQIHSRSQKEKESISEKDTLCAICHDYLHCETKKDIFTYSCACNGRHKYHLDCIINWFETDKTDSCPECREAGIIGNRALIDW